MFLTPSCLHQHHVSRNPFLSGGRTASNEVSNSFKADSLQKVAAGPPQLYYNKPSRNLPIKYYCMTYEV